MGTASAFDELQFLDLLDRLSPLKAGPLPWCATEWPHILTSAEPHTHPARVALAQALSVLVRPWATPPIFGGEISLRAFAFAKPRDQPPDRSCLRFPIGVPAVPQVHATALP